MSVEALSRVELTREQDETALRFVCRLLAAAGLPSDHWKDVPFANRVECQFAYWPSWFLLATSATLLLQPLGLHQWIHQEALQRANWHDSEQIAAVFKRRSVATVMATDELRDLLCEAGCVTRSGAHLLLPNGANAGRLCIRKPASPRDGGVARYSYKPKSASSTISDGAIDLWVAAELRSLGDDCLIGVRED